MYIRTKQLISSHPLLGLLRLGIYINQLNTEEGKSQKIVEVRNKVFNKYGNDGIKVLNLASTGQLSYVLDDLDDYYKRTKCDNIELCKLFDYILREWTGITIFVKSEHSEKEIEKMICEKAEIKYPYFFIFSFGSASEKTYLVIARLIASEYFRKNNYLMPQLRYRGKRDNYAWVVEYIEKNIVSFMEYKSKTEFTV